MLALALPAADVRDYPLPDEVVRFAQKPYRPGCPEREVEPEEMLRRCEIGQRVEIAQGRFCPGAISRFSRQQRRKPFGANFIGGSHQQISLLTGIVESHYSAATPRNTYSLTKNDPVANVTRGLIYVRNRDARKNKRCVRNGAVAMGNNQHERLMRI